MSRILVIYVDGYLLGDMLMFWKILLGVQNYTENLKKKTFKLIILKVLYYFKTN